MTSIMDKFVNKFKKDGVDHVRIALNGDTAVGRMSALEYRKTFFIPQLGSFLTPICFANWMATGDDEARHDPTYRVNKTIQGYLQYVMFAKFWQLVTLRDKLKHEMKPLPFVSYRVYENGIREFDRWKEYAVVIKDMVEHILDPQRGPKVPFAYPEGVVATVDKRVEEIVRAFKEASGEDGAPASEQRKTGNKNRHKKHAQRNTAVNQEAPSANGVDEQQQVTEEAGAVAVDGQAQVSEVIEPPAEALTEATA